MRLVKSLTFGTYFCATGLECGIGHYMRRVWAAGRNHICKSYDIDELKRRADAGETSAWYPSMQTFPFYILYHLWTYYSGYSLPDQTKKIPAYLWSLRWRLRLNTFHVRSLLSVDCGACGIVLKPSKIMHDSDGCGVFVGRPFGTRQIVGYCYGTLVYSNLTKQKQARKTYVDGIMSVSVADFNTWGFKLPKKSRDGAENKIGALTVPAPSCCI